MHGIESFAAWLLVLAAIVAVAKLGGAVASRAGQPRVLGELVAGIALGNLGMVGVPWLRAAALDPAIDTLAGLGAVLLLFEVGLESTVGDMMRVGTRALLVAVVGVVTPWLLGWGVSAWILPERGRYVHVFLGAVLTATSVGITARVLRDMGRSRSPEARIILGAAVIDDVLGLIVLAVLTGMITAVAAGVAVSWAGVGLIVVKAVAFLGGALLVGVTAGPRLLTLAGHFRHRVLLLGAALAFCFALAYGASLAGLAPIVGAYAAGLVLEHDPPLEPIVRPIGTLLIPVFFVVMGMRVELAAFANLQTLGLGLLLTLAAIVGKQACAIGGLGAPLDRLSIGIGMVPRGEVGLIFASLGLRLMLDGEPILDRRVYSAVVLMVLLTTLVTPIALKWSLSRRDRATGTYLAT